MNKAQMQRVIELKSESLSQAEISRKLGISKSCISTCVNVYQMMIEDLSTEKMEIEQERQEHRRKEVKRVKKKLSELKVKEKDIQNEDK